MNEGSFDLKATLTQVWTEDWNWECINNKPCNNREKNVIIHVKKSWNRKLKWKGRAIGRKDIVDIATKMGKLQTDHILAVVLTC